MSVHLIAFDLGDTLVEYEGLPLSWETHYPAALTELARSLALAPTPIQIEAACTALRSHNTRLYPREKEISFAQVLADILPHFGVATTQAEILGCARAFFRIFRERLRCFSDTRAALTAIRQRNYRIGVFTDVPYGMPRALVDEDISAAGLPDLLDIWCTSTDAGWRKPSPRALQYLAQVSDCAPADMTYVGNERKDIAAARAFGCQAILLDRNRENPDWGQDRTISLLSEL